MDVCNEAEFAALRRILEISRGTSSFTVATCNSPVLRESLFARLRTERIAFGAAIIVLGSVDPVHEARVQIPTGTVEAVFVIGLDYLLAESSADSDRLLAVLNRSRERWRLAFPNQPLVFWLTPHTSVRLTTHAPDLRAWISHELEFEDAVGTGIRPDQLSLSRNHTWLVNLDAAAKRARLEDLEKRLSFNPPESALFQEWARAWEEKIWLLSLLGELVAAEQAARSFLDAVTASDSAFVTWRAEAATILATLLVPRGAFDEAVELYQKWIIPIQAKLGNHRALAMAKGELAQILTTRGNFDEAERLLRDEVLPALAAESNSRDYAIAKSYSAQLLLARGQLDEAYRMLRHEIIPVLHLIEDEPSRAAALFGVAAILQRTGAFGDSLGLLSNEVLPVFVRYGDMAEQSVCLRAVAHALLAQGQIDEAIRVLRDEELPIHQRLGATHPMTLCRARLAFALKRRGRPEDVSEAIRLLTECHRTAREKHWPEAKQYETLLLGWGIPQEWLKTTWPTSSASPV
jgi:tetratricopeptide (TPR) repeat protein